MGYNLPITSGLSNPSKMGGGVTGESHVAKTKRLTNRQVQLTVRAAWEAAELRNDPIAQGRHLADQLCTMLGGDFAFACILGDFRIGKVPQFLFATTGSAKPEELAEYFSRLGTEFTSLDDPVMDVGRALKDIATLRMSDLLQQVETSAHERTIDLMNRVGTKDALIGLFRRIDRNTAYAFSVHRTAIRRKNDDREQAIMKLLVDELNHLYSSGRLEPARAPGTLTALSPRMRQIAAMLMTDRSAKQIGRELNLTTETTRFYIKEVYKRLGVGSRQELILRLVSGNKP